MTYNKFPEIKGISKWRWLSGFFEHQYVRLHWSARNLLGTHTFVGWVKRSLRNPTCKIIFGSVC